MAPGNLDGSEQASLRQYLRELGQHERLTGEEEVSLAKAIEAGRQAYAELNEKTSALSGAEKRGLRNLVRAGDEARDRLIQANLRLVVWVAVKHDGPGRSLLDLIQDGNLGLLRAVDKFDWRYGTKFSTYAVWWIRQSIQRGTGIDTNSVRLSKGAQHVFDQARHSTSDLEQFARTVGMGVQEVHQLLALGGQLPSLDQPVSADETMPEDPEGEQLNEVVLGEVVEDRSAASPFEESATALLPEEIERLLAPLDEREREIIKLRFGLDRGKPRTLEEVGEHFNLTRERVRQLEERALKKLRHPRSDTGSRDLLAV